LGVGRGGQLPTVPSNLNFQNKNKNKIFWMIHSKFLVAVDYH
jgi:hypothetical protein